MSAQDQGFGKLFAFRMLSSRHSLVLHHLRRVDLGRRCTDETSLLLPTSLALPPPNARLLLAMLAVRSANTANACPKPACAVEDASPDDLGENITAQHTAQSQVWQPRWKTDASIKPTKYAPCKHKQLLGCLLS